MKSQNTAATVFAKSIQEAERARALSSSTKIIETSAEEASADEEFDFVGLHLLASYEACDLDALMNPEALLKAMEEGVVLAGASVINTVSHTFPGGGFTALVLLAESHASIHTYPEHKSCFVDIFTCGTRCIPENFDMQMRKYFKPARVSSNTILRGSPTQA